MSVTTRLRGEAPWLCLAACCGLSACGGVNVGSGCPTDQPSGFACQRQLSVEQGQCMGDADGSVLTPSVHWSTDGKALLVQAAAFRCDQSVCAYLDASSATAHVLLQPCEMHPGTVTRCDCGYSFNVPITLPASTKSVDVELRSDSIGGSHESRAVGTLAVSDTAKLCDGTAALRFAATNGGGGPLANPTFITEVGFSFLLVDGQCRYYAMTAPDHEIRSGVLSEAEAASLSADFLLGNWQGLDQPGSGCADAGTDAFAFGTDRAQSSCTNTPLTMANYTWLPRLYDAGKPVGGDMRYALIAASNEQWPESNPDLAMPYALGDPSSIVSEPFAPAQVQVATGADAAALRKLRSAYQAQTLPVLAPEDAIAVVVTSTNGARYLDLDVRDTVPFEKDGALAIDAFIQ